MDINYKKIESKNELLEFIHKLRTENPDDWENIKTSDFLEALGAWLESADGFYTNFGLAARADEPSWQLFADALQAATIYE